MKHSRGLYAEAFSKAPDNYYTGINAASKSVFLGTAEDLLKAYAGMIEEKVGATVWPDNYRITATVAEMLLI